MTSKADACNFAYTRVLGSAFDVVLDVRSLVAPDYYSKCALMVRQDGGTGAPAGGDPNVCNVANAEVDHTGVPAADYVSYQYRDTRDAASANAGTADFLTTYPNTWMRIKRDFNN